MARRPGFVSEAVRRPLRGPPAASPPVSREGGLDAAGQVAASPRRRCALRCAAVRTVGAPRCAGGVRRKPLFDQWLVTWKPLRFVRRCARSEARWRWLPPGPRRGSVRPWCARCAGWYAPAVRCGALATIGGNRFSIRRFRFEVRFVLWAVRRGGDRGCSFEDAGVKERGTVRDRGWRSIVRGRHGPGRRAAGVRHREIDTRGVHHSGSLRAGRPVTPSPENRGTRHGFAAAPRSPDGPPTGEEDHRGSGRAVARGFRRGAGQLG